MFLFATRPLNTFFWRSPTGWYRYHWEVGTNPSYVEFGNAETNAFLMIHGLVAMVLLSFAIWLLAKWHVAKTANAQAARERESARKAKELELDQYQKAVQARNKGG